MRGTTTGTFLWARPWTHKSHEGWTIALLDDRKREVRLDVLARNAPADLTFPAKHTRVEIALDLPLQRGQPTAVLAMHAIRVRRIFSVRPIQIAPDRSRRPE